MKKYTTILLMAFVVATSALGQEKKTIAITPFAYSKTDGAKIYASSLSEFVSTVFVKTNRFMVVDRTSFEAIMSEDNLQKGESFIDGQVVEQGKKLGAQFIITGILTSASAKVSTSQEFVRINNSASTTEGWKGQISYTMKVISVETGTIIATDVISVNNTEVGGLTALTKVVDKKYSTQEEAITGTMRSTEPKLLDFINRNFPLLINVYKIEEEKGGIAKKIIIAGGSDSGVALKQDYKIVEYEEIEFNGKKTSRSIEIGKISVESVDDANFSTCKVKEGGDKIVSSLQKKPTGVFAVLIAK